MEIVQAYATKNRCYQVAALLTRTASCCTASDACNLIHPSWREITISTDPTVTSGSVYTFTTTNNNKGYKNNELYGSK